MPKTATEKIISQSRKGGLLVPMLEERLRHQIEIENEDDANFIYDLAMKQVERERIRNAEKKISPSSLAACLRQVYLKRHYKEHDIIPMRDPRIEPNFYFLTGDWLHLKWQFVLWKMQQEEVEGFKLLGLEIPVNSKRGDHGGTIDAAVELWGEPFIVDFKGLNTRDAQKAERGEVDLKYRIQLADYMILYNSDRSIPFPKVKRGLIIVENKGGPSPNKPIALSEVEISSEEHKDIVQLRLGELRRAEEENSIPPPSCESPYSIQFGGCPFRKFCKKEVSEIYRDKREVESRHTARLKVATPDRKRRTNSRGNSRR